MLRLIKAHLAASWEPNLGDRAPSLFVHPRTLHARFTKCCHLGLQVVTHEIQLMPAILISGMKCGLCWRKSKDQPPTPGIHRRKMQDVPEEGTVRIRVFAIYDYMRARDHGFPPATRSFHVKRYQMILNPKIPKA
jgi:hypothetical protein